MINDNLKKILCGIVATRYQNNDSFEIDINITKDNYNIFGDDFKLPYSNEISLTINNLVIKFDKAHNNIVIIHDHNSGEIYTYEFHQINSRVWLMLDVDFDIVNRISTIELTKTESKLSIKMNSVSGDNYNINSIDNFWISVLTGTLGKRANIYCIKSDNHALWVKRRYDTTEIAMAYNYPSERRFTLQLLNTPGTYTLYRFDNSSIASIVFEHPKHHLEKDVMITANTITEVGKTKTYMRVQKGTCVYYK